MIKNTSPPLGSEPPTIDGFTFVRPIGSGSTANVYLYRQLDRNRPVAVKVGNVARHPQASARIAHEAHILGLLPQHPHILPLLAMGTAGPGLNYLVFEYASGGNCHSLLRTRETRNTCTYCSVGCGLLMYSLGDGAKNAKASIFHIEGDPDHPVNRGALCPKGAGLVDFIHSESRLKFPEYRAPGSDKWQQISWEEAFDRIAKLMKEDRDANYIAQNAEGVTVNRWLSTGMLCASASSNETGYLTQKFSRALGMLAVDNQARV